MNIIKNKLKNRITNVHLNQTLQLTLSSYEPDYEKGIIDQGIADGKIRREIAIIINRSQKIISNYNRNRKCMGRPSKVEDLV